MVKIASLGFLEVDSERNPLSLFINSNVQEEKFVHKNESK
jgi:hypothetical protein